MECCVVLAEAERHRWRARPGAETRHHGAPAQAVRAPLHVPLSGDRSGRALRAGTGDATLFHIKAMRSAPLAARLPYRCPLSASDTGPILWGLGREPRFRAADRSA